MRDFRIVTIVRSAICFSLTSMPLMAQRPVLVRHYSLPTMDLGVIADTTQGIGFIASPSLRSREGQESTKIIWLYFAPDSLRQWLDSAKTYLNTPAGIDEPDGTRWTSRMKAVDQSGWLTFGRRIHKHGLAKQRYVLLADSTNSWKFEVTEVQLGHLQELLREAGSLSRLTTIDRPFQPGAICEKPDQWAAIVYEPAPQAMGGLGRVAMQYVVDTTGRAEMNTFVALLATNPSLEEAARNAILQSRFKPAILHGRPVRQLIRQAAVFH